MQMAGKRARAISALAFGAAAMVHAEFWILPELPGGAEIVEYIATANNTGAYFDTGINGANDMTTRVEFAFTTAPTANSGIFGNATTPMRYRIYYILNKSFGVGMGSGGADGTGWKETFFKPVAGTRYDFEIASGIGAGSGTIRINDLYYTMGNTDTGAWSTSDNLCLFRSYTTSTYAKYTRLYALKISSAAGTLRSYIPVVSNNVPCLYDTVSGTFLLKSGTQSITYGPIVTNALEQLSSVQRQTFCRLLDDSALIVSSSREGFGEASPSYGAHMDIALESEFTVSVAPPDYFINDGATRLCCTGHVCHALDTATGARTSVRAAGPESSFTYTHAGATEIEWLWCISNRLSVTSAGHGAFSVNGGELSASVSHWVASDNPAVTLTAHPAEGYEFYMWQGDIDASLANSPSVTLSLDAPKSLTATFIEVTSGTVFYVAPTGSDTNNGIAWVTAFETVKHAIDTANLVDGPATIRVAKGSYTENVQADITNAVTLISVDGAADTTLQQTIDTRHSIVQLGHPGCRVEGFTFSGHTTASGDYNPVCGAVKITSEGGTLADCVIKSNKANTYYARGTAVMLYGGVMDSCVIVSNTSDNSHAPVYIHGGSAPVEMRNCLVAHNRNRDDAVYVAGNCKFRALISNCTIADNRASAGKTAFNALRISSQSTSYITNVVVENTIILNNLCSGGTVSYGYPNWMVGDAAMTNQFRNCLAAVPPNSSCITEDPQFVDPDSLDYSVYPSSPAVDAGVANGNVRDLPGLARPSGAGIDIGAYEYDQSRFSTSFAVNEPYALAGTPLTCMSTTFGSSAAQNLAYAWSVTNSTTGATFTGTEADFTLAGPSAGLYTVVLTVTDNGVNPAAVATFSPAEPVSRSVATMYVTPGNEANEQFPYDTPAKGAALITTAYKHALDNTTLMLEPGVHPLTVQLIIRKGVNFIGHGENRPAIIKQTTYQERVLYIDHKDAYFENLAVTGGRKGSNGNYGGEIPNARDQLGCGVCMNAGGTFYNCSITNNAYIEYYVYGGGVGMKAGRLDRCLIADNSITSAAGDTYYGSGVYLTGGIVENSIITRNHTRYYGAVAINGANAVVRNCTIYGNDGLNVESAGLYYQNGTVQNCAVFNNISTRDNDFGPSAAAASEKISNCASVNGFGTDAVVCSDPIFTAPETFDFSFGAGSDLRNAGVAYDGAGDATDYLGQPRVSGGAIDIGATEYQETAASCGISFSPKSELLVGESVTLTATFAGIDETNGLNCAWSLTNAFGQVVATNGHEVSLALPAGHYDIALEVTGAPDIEMSAFQSKLIRFVPPVMYADLLNESGAAYPWDGRANASTNIHELLDEAIDGCTIILVANAYLATNTIEISRAVTLRGESGRDATFLRIAWNTRLLKIMNAGAVVEGITIRESRMDNTRYCAGSIVYMTEGIFRDNRLTCCTNTGCNTDGLLYASGGTVERTLIDRNKASNDYVSYHNHGTVYIGGSAVMRNCVVADNINDNYGGVNLNGGRVENCTIIGNLALFGGVGGLYVTYKGSRIINNIIYGNLSTPDNMATAPVPSDIAHGDIQGVATTTMFFNNCATQAIGTDCITDDPLLKGTGARPYQIPVKSPCVGIGLNDDWLETATDFYGNPRLSGHVVDIGATEASPAGTGIMIR